MTTDKNESLAVRALAGQHELVVATALRYVQPGAHVLDLGAWSGALAKALQNAGLRVTAADCSNHFELDTEFFELDFNQVDFDRTIASSFDLITSVEVIEHLENPTAFLRSIGRLLKPGGVAIVTTPNVDNIPARVKFLLRGTVRGMDASSPEHVTPIHLDLFVRKILPATNLKLIEHFVYPENEFPLTHRKYLWPFFRALSPFVKGPAHTGDSHVFVLKQAGN